MGKCVAAVAFSAKKIVPVTANARRDEKKRELVFFRKKRKKVPTLFASQVQRRLSNLDWIKSRHHHPMHGTHLAQRSRLQYHVKNVYPTRFASARRGVGNNSPRGG